MMQLVYPPTPTLKFCVPVLWILEHAIIVIDTIHLTSKRKVSVLFNLHFQNIFFTLIPSLSNGDGGDSNF